MSCFKLLASLHSKKALFTMSRFLFRGKVSLQKIINRMRGKRSNKSLILVRYIEVGFLCLFVISVIFLQVLGFYLACDPSLNLYFCKRNLVKLKRNLVSVSVPWKRNLFTLKSFLFVCFCLFVFVFVFVFVLFLFCFVLFFLSVRFVTFCYVIY